MDNTQNETISWITNPMHTFLKNLLIIGLSINTIGFLVLGIVQIKRYDLPPAFFEIILALLIALPLGFALVFRYCPKRIGISEKKIVIDWYIKPEVNSIDNSISKKYFPEATKMIKAPNEIRFENIVDFKIFNYAGGSWQSGGFYYMIDKSVLNTSGIGLGLNNIILSALHRWLTNHAPESQLFIKLEAAREK